MIDLKIPHNVEVILERLKENGYEGYAVGGCVRDTILGRVPEDWDITTSASPKQIKKLFRRTIDTGIQHGTVTVMIGEEGYEVTTYRVDGEYEDHRHPAEVMFTPNLEEDLRRRDFTINAMAYNPEKGIIDKFDGIKDIERKTVRCVGNPYERFEEDALRMLRGIRFAGQLQFQIEEKTLQAVQEKASTLVKVSAERIRTELTKLLLSNGADRLLLASKTGLSKYFLPELEDMLATPQNNPHHCFDVGHHSIQVILHINRIWDANREWSEKEHIILVYAGLLHDVAKPDCKTTDEQGIDHFYSHNVLGREKAKSILQRLKFDNFTIDMVLKLIQNHDNRHENCFLDGNYSPKGKKAMRHLMNRIGREAMPLLFILQQADLMAQSEYTKEEKLEKLEAAKRCFREISESGDPITLKELAISGKDLMNMGIKAGPEIGTILQKLLEAVLENPGKNTTDNLMEMAMQFVDKE